MIFQSFIRQTVKFLTFKIEKYIGGVLSLFALWKASSRQFAKKTLPIYMNYSRLD